VTPTDDIRIRAATADDAAAISALTCASTRLRVAPDCTADGAARLLASMRPEDTRQRLLQGHRYVVAERAGGIVGVAAMRLPAHLYHLFVDDAVQRRGLARRLWQALLAACPNETVTVNAARNAVEAYLRLGFVREGPEDASSGIPSTPMRWRRPPPA